MRRYILRAFITAALLAVAAAGYTYTTYAKWSTSQATFYVNPANADVSSTAALWAIDYALNVWNNAGSSFRFQYGGTVSDTNNAYDNRNVVIFRNASNGSAIASTYSWWNSSNQLLDSDVIIWDGAFRFYTGTSGCGGVSNSAYLEDIATHELGHALGLNHSSSSDATMYPSYGYCSQETRTLSSDDVNGLRALYPGGGNTAPTVSISSPANGASFLVGAPISLAASAFDAQDGNLTPQIVWTDNGSAIGSGGLVSTLLNLAGVHVLVARVTDSGGLQGSSQVSITINLLPTNAPPTVSIGSPASGTTATAPASFTVTAAAADAEGPVSSVAFWANSTLLGTDSSSPFNMPWSNVAAGSYALTAMATDSGGRTTWSAPVNVTVSAAAGGGGGGGGGTRVNVALAASGATATASSSYSSNYPASAAINGDRRGMNYGRGGTWSDATPYAFPDWIEVAFASSKTIDEIDVFAVQDAYASPVDPTPTMTCRGCGVTDFTLQYWNGSGWATVPNGVVRGNGMVWRTITFAPIATSRIRLLVEGSADSWSQVSEIEAYESSAGNTAPSVSLTSPASGATASAPASFTLTAAASDAEGPVSSVAFYANSTLLGQDFASPFSMPWSGVTAGSYALSAVATDAGGRTTWSSPVNVTVTGSGGGGGGGARVNVALAANGATATASSTYSGNWPASAVNNGDRRGTSYGRGGTWSEASPYAFPDWIEIAFAGSKTIDQIDLFAIQDAYSAPVDPTPSLTCKGCGVTDFTLQYWNGSGWVTVPNGVVRGNNLVWRTLSFAPIATSRIRLLIEGSVDGWSQAVELEAWGTP